MTGQLDRLASFDGLRLAWTSYFQSAVDHTYLGLIAGGIDVNPVFPLILNGQGSVGRVHLNRIVGRQLTNGDAKRTLFQSELENVISEIGYGQIGAFPQAHGVRSDLELGPGALVGVDAIACRGWKIKSGLTPLVQTCAQKRNIAF